MYKLKYTWLLLPVVGTILFLLLFFIATRYYPGGSQADSNAVGFSWLHNYWCNLLNEQALNGQYNPTKPIAITGMVVLYITLAFFWLIFPRYINIDKKIKTLIQASGTLSMAIAILLFTSINHDLVTNLASGFGLLATMGTLIGLYQTKCYGLFVFGLLNILLVGLNNYVYYNGALIVYLPVIQKVSFLSFLTWICAINIQWYKLQMKPGV